MHVRRLIMLLLATALLTGCGARYLADGERLLYDNVLDVQMADSSSVSPEVKDALRHAENYYTERPNSKFLGIPHMRVGLWIYGAANPRHKDIFCNYLRRLGQAPRVHNPARMRQTAAQLQGLLEQKGCFGSTVTADTLKIDNHNISIAYHVAARTRYTIDEVVYRCDNPEVSRLIDDRLGESRLHAGDPYDQDNLGAERERLASDLREAGYFRASREMVSFVVDTSYSTSRLSIEVVVAARDQKVYHINNVYIYPNSTARLATDAARYDTLIHTYPLRSRTVDFQFVYDRPMSIHPQTISRAMLLFPGITYRPTYVSNTYNALLNLRNFKYINIEFTEPEASADSLPLVDAHVRLVRSNQQKLSFSVELTNASPLGGTDTAASFFGGGNVGIETALEYQHKNLFHGAELFRLKGSLLMELPKLALGGGDLAFYDRFSAFEATLESSLDMPTFLLPIHTGIVWQRVHPHTLISVGGSYQYHYYYERILGNASFGYQWSSSPTRQHQLLPVELTYVSMLHLDDAFANRLAGLSDLRLKYQYSSHFILDARYDFRHSTQRAGVRTNFRMVRLSVESAGNLLSAISRATGSETDSSGVRQLLGVPFAQYERLTGEYTRYLYHGQRSSLVLHALAGVGLPFGNSVAMPYEKSFFGGGPTSLRAWQLRRLGPGGFIGEGGMFERVGDMQLVFNIEERFPIISILEGAVFVDAGNVWLMGESDQFPGGEFRADSFFRQLAVGVGLGLRVNVSVATLRLDLAIPLVDPGFEATWRLPHWKPDQLVANLGIGYPF